MIRKLSEYAASLGAHVVTPLEVSISPDETYVDCDRCDTTGEIVVRLNGGHPVDSALCPKCLGDGFVIEREGAA